MKIREIIKNQEEVNELNKTIKTGIIDILISSGLAIILKMFWDLLEILFDGGTQPSISDTIIAMILIQILWRRIRKWIVVN